MINTCPKCNAQISKRNGKKKEWYCDCGITCYNKSHTYSYRVEPYIVWIQPVSDWNKADRTLVDGAIDDGLFIIDGLHYELTKERIEKLLILL